MTTTTTKETTMTTTRHIRHGALVALSSRTLNTDKCATVFHRSALDSDSLDPSIADAGWRIAEFPNTKYRILVRPTTDRRIGNSSAFNVECRTIDNGVRFDEDNDTFAICAVMGDARANCLARYDDVVVLETP
tara:strand:- start:894 stop:1292 length:399 start_codon:yes stop_codon:yes gene_type:complete